MKSIITGGIGFIGSHVQNRLVNLGHEVLIIDSLRSGKENNLNPKSILQKADIRDREAMFKIFNDFKPDNVFHLAAQNEVPFSMEHPDEDLQINITGMINLLDAAKSLEKKPKFIYSNTGGAFYGDVETLDIPLVEDYTVKLPTSFYGVSKSCAELYLKLYGHIFEIPFVSLRYANVYGPRQDGNREAGIVAIFTSKMLKGETPTIFGDGSHQRDYVFVDDVVDANIAALNFNGNDYFNIATGILTSNNEVFEILKKTLNLNMNVSYAPARAGDALINALSPAKAEKLMGWKPKTSFEEGIRKTVEYYKK
jgi:UDP-glucose 4-epimerase